MARPGLLSYCDGSYAHMDCAPPLTWADYMQTWSVHPDSDLPPGATCNVCGGKVSEEPKEP